MPKAIVDHEAPLIDSRMKRAILKLYRSAKDSAALMQDFCNIADRGLVVWGADDRFVPVKVAHRFCECWKIKLAVEEGVGHWGICERPAAFARHREAHWAG